MPNVKIGRFDEMIVGEPIQFELFADAPLTDGLVKFAVPMERLLDAVAKGNLGACETYIQLIHMRDTFEAIHHLAQHGLGELVDSQACNTSAQEAFERGLAAFGLLKDAIDKQREASAQSIEEMARDAPWWLRWHLRREARRIRHLR